MTAFKLTASELQWVKRNLHTYTSRQQYEHIMGNRLEEARAKYTTFRTALYKRGLKKCDILRWTKEETQFLLDNIATMGNIEIAKKLSKKGRKFKKKNVEKKMVLMGLSRTPEQLQSIIEKHKKSGSYRRGNLKRWDKKRIQEGERKVQIVNGRPYVMVKVNGILIRYARFRYQQLHGEIPKGMKIYHRDMDPLNVEDDNLYASTSTLNSEQRMTYDRNSRRYFEALEAKQPKAPEPVKEKPVDNTKRKIAVRINSRTIVYVPAGTNIKAFKKKFEYQKI